MALEDNTPPPENVSRIHFKALGMRTGMALQTRRLVDGATKKESQFFGAIESKGVMVGPLGPDGVKTELEEGDVCVVRGFTGQYEFSFLSKVLQTFEKPFAYALLAYPAQVDARMVRQSMRTKVSWPTTVQRPAGANNPADHVTVALVDISMQGAMIEAPVGMGAIGDILDLCIQVQVDDTPAMLLVAGRICHSNKAPGTDGQFIGLAFKDLKQQDKLLLHYMTQTAST